MLLEIRNLRVNYGKVAAVQDLSIQIDRGEVVTIIGANGAGKTTLMRTISGLKAKSSGEMWFKGQRIDVKPPERILRLGIAHVPEGRRVFPYLSVFDNLMIGAYTRKDQEEVRINVEKVYTHFPRLKERTQQRGGSLSGGEQQMLAIGRALMSKPEMLLLDEPSLGLAPKMVAEVGRIIQEINRNDVTIVLVEQNASMALKVAQRGYVMVTGEIVVSSDTKGLIGNADVKKAYLGI